MADINSFLDSLEGFGAPEKKTGFVSDIKRGTGQIISGAGSTLRDLGADEVGQRVEKYGSDIVRENPSSINSFFDILENPGTTVREAVGEVIPQVGGVIGGRVVGGVLGLPFGPAGVAVGQTVGSLVSPFVTSYGGIRSDQRESGQEDIGRALMGAIPATALERFGGAERVASKVLGEGTDFLAREAGTSLLKNVGKQGARGFIEESLTEVPQSALERFGAFKELASPEALDEYAVAGIKGGFGGAAIRGGLSAVAGERQSGSLLGGSNDQLTGNATPDADAIRKAINTDREVGVDIVPAINPYDVGGFVSGYQAGQDTTLDSAQGSLFGGAAPNSSVQGLQGAPTIAQAQAAQQAAQQAQGGQQAQEVDPQELATTGQIYGVKPIPNLKVPTWEVAGVRLYTPQAIQKFLTDLTSLNKDKTAEQLAIESAFVVAGLVKINQANAKTLVNTVAKQLEKYQVATVQTVAEAAEIINDQIQQLALAGKGASDTNVTNLAQLYEAMTGQEAPAYELTQTNVPKKGTNVPNIGTTLTKGEANEEQQVSTGVGAVPVTSGAPEGDGSGNVQPTNVQSIQPGSEPGRQNLLQNDAGGAPGARVGSGGAVGANVLGSGSQQTTQGAVNGLRSDQGTGTGQATNVARQDRAAGQGAGTIPDRSAAASQANRPVVTEEGLASAKQLWEDMDDSNTPWDQVPRAFQEVLAQSIEKNVPVTAEAIDAILLQIEASKMDDAVSEVLTRAFNRLFPMAKQKNKAAFILRMLGTTQENRDETVRELAEDYGVSMDTIKKDWNKATIDMLGSRNGELAQAIKLALVEMRLDATQTLETIQAIKEKLVVEGEEIVVDLTNLNVDEDGQPGDETGPDVKVKNRKAASVQEVFNKKETINAKYLRLSTELENAENDGNEERVAELEKELATLAEQAAGKKEPKEAKPKKEPKVKKEAKVTPKPKQKDGNAFFSQEAINGVDQGRKSRSIIVQMSPNDFLRMAEPGLSTDRVEEVRQVAEKRTKFSTIPKLTTQEDPKTGVAKVIGSDGRHRATVLKSMGVASMPVELRSMIRWSEQSDPENFDYWTGKWPATLEAEKSTETMPYPVERPVSAESKVQTIEEQAAAAWDKVASTFPEAPKFADLTEDQRKTFIEFGPDNWTEADVQNELIKLAKPAKPATEMQQKIDGVEPSQASRTFIKFMGAIGVGSILPTPKAYASDFKSTLRKGQLTSALEQIAKGSANPAFRQLAKRLLALDTSKIRLKVIDPGVSYPEGIPSSLSYSYGVAHLDRQNKQVTVYLRGDLGMDEEVVLHETIHAVLAARYDLLNYYLANRKLQGSKADPALKLYEEVYDEFRAAVRKEFPGDKLKQAHISIREAYNNPDEFITYALTNEALQKWMQSKRYEGKTLWGKFVEFVKGVLGFGGTTPSWLDAALRVSNNLLDAAAQDAPNFAVSEKIFNATNKRSSERSIFAGAKSETFDAGKAAQAKIRQSAGEAPGRLFNELGHFIGPDGKVRYEINDRNAELNALKLVQKLKQGQTVKLPEVLDHPELYEAYPKLKNTVITLEGDVVAMNNNEGIGASTSPGTNAIALGDIPDASSLNKFSELTDELKAALLHEVQHIVQFTEGFTGGGSALTAFRVEDQNALGQLVEVFKRRIAALGDLNSTVAQVQREDWKRLLATISQIQRVSALDPKLVELGKEKTEILDEYEALTAGEQEIIEGDAAARIVELNEEIFQRLENKMGLSRQMFNEIQDYAYATLAGEFEARDVEARALNKRTGTPRLIDGTPMVVAGASIRANRSVKASKAIAALPPAARSQVQQILDTIKDYAVKALPTFAFTQDLADMAEKYIPSARKFVELFSAQQAIKTKYELEVSRILKAYNRLPSEVKGTGPKSVNKFLKDSTTSGKWGYKIKSDSNVTLDPELEARFNAFPKEAQEVIKSVFKHGYDTLMDMKKAVMENVNTEYDALITAAKEAGDDAEVADLQAKKKSTINQYESLLSIAGKRPYAPLKRFGNYVVVGRSQAYLDAEEAGNTKEMEKLQKDENHYFVQFAETFGEAKALEREESGRYALVQAFEKDKASESIYGGSDLNQVFFRLKNLAKETFDDKANQAAVRGINKLVNDLHLAMLAENAARQSENRRKNVAGADDDMMRAFASQGRATAHFIGSLTNTGEIYETLRQMKKEADTRTAGRDDRRRYYNEFMKRHAMGFDYNPNPILDKALAGTSMWMLLTNPAYYLQNLTQPIMMSVPYMAGKHSYGRSNRELMKAYGEVRKLLAKVSVDEKFDFSTLPADVRDMMETLVERGRIDISLEQDLGEWRSTEDTKYPALAKSVTFLRNSAQKVEMINRVATAIAAYRLEKERGTNDLAAINYADKVIRVTHGDYSGANAPRVMRTGAGRLITQFRKFQLIQISMMARLFNDAFKGASKEERDAARAALAWTFTHAGVAGGIMGLPGFYAIAAVFGALFGDDDEPENPELSLRRLFGEEFGTLMTKGLPAALGVDVSGKIGMGQMLSVLPYTDLDFSRSGYEKVVTAALGPFVGGLMPRAVDGLAYMGQGDYYKGIERLVPAGLTNAMKGYRIATEGETLRNNDKVLSADEVSFLDAAMQGLGLPTTKLSERQFRQGAQIEFEKFFNERTTELKRKYAKAYRANDTATMQEARDSWSQLQESRVREGFRRQPLSNLLKSPMEQAKRERNTAGGVQFTTGNRRFVEELPQ